LLIPGIWLAETVSRAGATPAQANKIIKREYNMDKRIIKTKDEAREFAVDWQQWQSEQAMFLSEIVEWQEYFYKLAKKFGLVREFKENGII
jgi:hypothetical protein